MDSASVSLLREMLASTGWLEQTRQLGMALRTTRSPGGLLVVGTPDDEPWHVTAHLADEAQSSGLAQLAPTLLRWAPPENAPAHLRVGMDRLREAGRGETLFVVAEQRAPDGLLERVDDARRTGVTILAVDGGDPELESLAHDAIAVRPDDALVSFDAAQHLVSAAAGDVRRPGFRERLARFAERVTGPRLSD
ncbi:hypothetical protein [Planotetraspora kaengkrachanensis]|uniref:Uncharacterized protein n=1 Tax=Planotetraspora kaengkrachanensis TaxID=575193 RepID=A0A8J3M1E5_9ACTN|nr:hypothetical protein [Planotetraspora kaengkrachanensis]GIG77256.1 hypothetical protein Pka01_03830 [Planotetraspora kaengkrachanensis]